VCHTGVRHVRKVFVNKILLFACRKIDAYILSTRINTYNLPLLLLLLFLSSNRKEHYAELDNEHIMKQKKMISKQRFSLVFCQNTKEKRSA